MANFHPFQKHMCIIFVSIGLISYYLTMKESVLIPNRKPFGYSINESHSGRNTDYLDYFGINYTAGNMFNHSNHFSYLLNSSGQQGNPISRIEHVVNILGLFELSTQWGRRAEGKSEILAAELAIEHINKMDILPGYSLNLLINDTKCDPGTAVDRFFHALYSSKNILVLLGSSCSNVTESLARVVPYWNIPQVSFGSMSPSLSDRNKFPLFFRTVAPDSSHNTAKIQFIKYFGWEFVAAFSQSENTFLLPINHLVKDLEIANISCVATITFSFDNYKEQLKILKGLDIRIIIGSFSTKMAPEIFCEAFQLQMYGDDYVWILQDQQDLWWNSSWRANNCGKDQLKQATSGLVLVSDVNSIADNETSASGLTVDDFGEQLLALNSTTISKYINYVYDAVWAIAFALRGNRLITCSASKYYYHRRREMVAQFVEDMESLNFMGLSGPVKFAGPDRVGDSMISQMQNGKRVQIAVYESDKDKLYFTCNKCSAVSWQNGRVPVAQRILKTIVLKIPILLYCSICFMSVLGICASLSFLCFSLRFRRVRSLKLSSPKLNNVAVFGCILVYLSVILMEMDKVTENLDTFFTGLCTAKASLLSAGFSLVSGAIFAKTYRVHKLFNNCRTSVVKTKLLKDSHLIVLIATPVLIDAIIFALWVVIDPMDRKLHNISLETSSRVGLVYQKQVALCGSNNTTGWYFTLYGYKVLVLIMGVFMAWENRHVKVPTLNDVQYIGICVYSVVFTAIMLVLSNFIAEYVILSYLSGSCSILLATSLTLVLLFLPQFRLIFGRMKNDDLLMQSMGLKFECNTRRFIYKDQKELLNRLEIQNRVFKCEIRALDDEIRYLENLLLKSSTSSNISTSVYTISKPSYLNAPELACGRASWPTSCSQSVAGARFSSENKLNEHFFDRFRIFGKLKRFFGSLSSIDDIGSHESVQGNIPQVGDHALSDAEDDSVVSLEIVYQV